ncbi:MAG: SIS domain-containing protein [Thermoplasmatota archaeon]
MNERFSESLNYILKHIMESLTNYDVNDLDECLDIITKSKQIFVYGAGRSGLVGRMFAMRLMQIGLRAFFIGETITPAVNGNDCVFFVSKTGETQTAIQAAKIVNERVEAKTILLTASPDSTLAGYCDTVLHIDIQGNDRDKELAPLGTIFEDAAVIFLDSLIAALMKYIGETEEGMRMRHPILV